MIVAKQLSAIRQYIKSAANLPNPEVDCHNRRKHVS